MPGNHFTVHVADPDYVMSADGLLVLGGLAALTGEISLVSVYGRSESRLTNRVSPPERRKISRRR